MPAALLLLDYDGTLAPIVRNPARAVLGVRRRALLRRLARLPGVRVGIVSGRELAWLRRQVGVPGLLYVGNHGLEMSGPGLRFVHAPARRHAETMRRLAARLRAALRGIPGAVVEAKGLTLSVHRRMVPPSQRPVVRHRAAAVLDPLVLAGRIRITRGKQVLEVRPPVAWTKGEAVGRLSRRYRAAGGALWYVGDDMTDEDAFRAVNRSGGISILLGRRRRSAAQWRVRSLGALERGLRLLERAWTR